MLLKVIELYKDESKLIKRALKSEREAQHHLYTIYAPKMLGVCRQYIKDLHYAEDVMIAAFFKVFTHLEKFKGEGSFEGWIRKIMIRECISFLRSRKKLVFIEDMVHDQEDTSVIDVESSIGVDEIQRLIDELPGGYRAVFVMYVVEGYSHKEIAEMLQISHGTSKSQLFKARKMLKENFLKQNTQRNGTK